MNSLRVRLILGSALVAVIPLAIAMLLQSRRIEHMVREQAEDRLKTSLDALQAELRSGGEEMVEKLRILSEDPVLKRLYLVSPVRRDGRRSVGLLRSDLDRYLADRRLLLGLGFIEVADTSGVVVADGASEHERMLRFTAATRIESRVSQGPFGMAVIHPRPAGGFALTAGAPILYQGEPAGIVQGGIFLDSKFLERLERSGGMDLVLRDGSGRVVASTLAGFVPPSPVTGFASPPPDSGPAPTDSLSSGMQRVTVDGRSYLSRRIPLALGTPPYADLIGFVSTASADRAVTSLRVTSALLALFGLGLAVALGFLWSAQISRPVERLATFSQRVARGEWDEPLSLKSVRELETLVEALDRMRKDLVTYRDRLVISERQAAWSQMARRVAHEIKNPLTPIAVSVSDLRRSYEQKREDFPAILDQATRTISEEVETMKHLLQEFSDYGRLPEPRLAPCRLGDLWVDLRTLYGREIETGRLTISEVNGDAAGLDLVADAGQIRQALVNLIKNGLEATDAQGRVTVEATVGTIGEATGGAMDLTISVSDTGPGLSPEQKRQLFLPGFTTKSEGSGLGLAIVERIVSDHGGTIGVESQPGAGTTFRLRLPRTGRS